MRWEITDISIRGIKGLLSTGGDFRLKKGQSVAIFAPNGMGKSGYADALEYLFSADGGVGHLGLGSADSEHGGKHALRHVLADEKGVTPQTISIEIRDRDSKKSLTVKRELTTGASDSMPSELQPLIDNAPASRIIRQHDLRRFVVDLLPREKYAEITRWLGLGLIETVQTQLTTARNALPAMSPDDAIKERGVDFGTITKGEVVGPDVDAALSWCAEVASPHLDADPKLAQAIDIGPVLVDLKNKSAELGSATEEIQTTADAESLARSLASKEAPLALYVSAVGTALRAAEKAETAREDAKESVFLDVWTAAKEALGKELTEVCPICLTPWSQTTVGSHSNAVLHITSGLKGLQELTKALRSSNTASHAVAKSATEIRHHLEVVATGIEKGGFGQLAKDCRELRSLIASPGDAKYDIVSAGDKAVPKARQLMKAVEGELGAQTQTEDAEEDHSAASTGTLEQAIERLTSMESPITRLEQLHAERDELSNVADQLRKIDEAIESSAARLVEKVISELESDMQCMYRKIHGDDAVPKIQMTPDVKSKTLQFRIDFYEEGRTLPPAGYLSDSQVSSLALALFLSASQRLNKTFPFIVLDDIVSSYDAEHRARIVDVIAESLAESQLFITTHDHMFYRMLRNRLPPDQWVFDRITTWSLEDGPKRQSEPLDTDQINSLIDNGDPQIAGNAVRQYMEDWLDRKCALYEVRTVHRRDANEYQRTLYDYWDPFVTRLKDVKGDFFDLRVDPAICYKRVAGDAVLSYYSHHQAHPYEWPAMGDVTHFWEAFREFEILFRCAACSKQLRYDHDAHRMYCVCGGEIFPAAAG